MAKAKKLPPALKTRITKLFKQGVLLPEIKAEIALKFPKINIPRIKTVLRSHFLDHCDELWRQAVYLKGNHMCPIDMKKCGLNAHHLIGRGNYKYRWDTENGICLGIYRHNMAHDMAAHGSTSATQAFAEWMEESEPEQWQLFQERRNDPEKITVDVYFLLETAKRLEAEIELLKNRPKVDIMARKKVGQ